MLKPNENRINQPPEETVVGTVADVVDGMAHVRMEKGHACHKCGACLQSGMDTSLLIAVQNTVGAAVGDCVEVAFSHGVRFKATALAYALPLSLLLIGVVAGQTLGGDVFAAVLGLSLAAGAFIWLKVSERKRNERGAFQPVLRRVIKEK